MANQTLPLNVSDEMKSDDERQNCVGMESGEELCSSSSDTTEELYSSSEPDTCRDCMFIVQTHGAKYHVNITLDMDELDIISVESKETYILKFIC